MLSVGTIPASANTGRSAAWTPKQAPRGSGAGAGPETPEVAARSTGPPGGALSDHGDPDEAPTGEWRLRGPAFSFAPHPSSARRAMSLRPLRSLPRVPRPSPLVPTSTQSPFCAHASRSPAVPSGLSGAGPGHCAHLSQVAGPVDGGDPDPVAGFLNWCRRVGLELSPKVSERAGGRRTRGGARAALTSPPPAQVAVSRQGTVAGYGMVARESVQAGELLFVVPRAALLSQHTCSIGGLLEREQGALQSQSGWVPLLLALLHELQAPASRWRPYFALWPELGRLEHPMFWPEEERRCLLQGTGVPEAVEKDLANIRSEYHSIVLPFMEAHPNLFSLRVRSLELYHQLVALVMAYSFQEPLEEEEDEKEPNSPVMVPAADILNHLANHNANLEYSAG
ncbi:N-lysine methyltransferase SETD6 isoform X6 [Chlorocebus sabaeus]|uniref:N-lysine methyltransferase SETD6 isoform X6 n=1 Tax=Chlorocebus sabaeus TaxID=60711 RepID=UPI003BF9F184